MKGREQTLKIILRVSGVRYFIVLATLLSFEKTPNYFYNVEDNCFFHILE